MKSLKLAAYIFTCFLSILSVNAVAQPFAISADGSEVTDKGTGLIWKRCSEGMTWSGKTCTGSPSTFSHEAAMQHAAQAGSNGIGWRAPDVKELFNISDQGRNSPAIDSSAFPDTPPRPFWTATPSNGNAQLSWVVNFSFGYVNLNMRVYNYHLRLVRNGK